MKLDPASLSLALAVLPLSVAPLETSQAVPSLDVMSFNIRYGTANDGEDRWEVRKPRTIAAIRRHPSAVIGLQEALAGQVEELTQALPGYESVGVGREDGKAKGEFSGILFDRFRLQILRSDTFWLSDTPTVPGSTHWGNRITRICTWAYFRDRSSGRYFYHFNAHLDHESQPSREKSIALILRKIAERGTDDPVILTGDFNVGEPNPVVSAVTAAGYRDTFRVLYPDEKAVGTFNGFRPAFGTDKIDYVFVGPEVRVLKAAIIRDRFDDRWPSDHAPVVATVQLP